MRKMLFVLFCSLFVACESDNGFMPENDLHKQSGIEEGSVTKEMFNQVIDEAVAYYKPIIQGHGGLLWVRRAWDDTTVNASAMQLANIWLVNMFGGLARRPEVTKDGFAMVLCHELGHHLAGYPYVQAWAANEGQSDYFAAMACGRALWFDKPETNAIEAKEVPETPRKLCEAKWDDEAELKLCFRIMLAGKSTADLLGAMKEVTVDFDERDENVVDVTNEKHPEAQCRLDTYMAGALCDAVWDDALVPGKSAGNSVEGEDESSTVTCTRNLALNNAIGDALNDIEEGFRPKCWFKSLR